MGTRYNRGEIEDFGRWREFTPGMWAWLLHKFTGWVLLGYLFVHIAVLSTVIPAQDGVQLNGQDLYTATLQGLEGLVMVRILEIGLVAAAAFHTFNGIRLLLMDLGVGNRYQREGFYAALWLTAIVVVVSVPILMGGL